jgi:hypothetical protein
LHQPAYIEAKTYVDSASAVVGAAFLEMLVTASVISYMKVQIFQIRVLDEIESTGFEGYEIPLSFIIGEDSEITGTKFWFILQSEINLPGQTRVLSPNIADSSPRDIRDHILIRKPLGWAESIGYLHECLKA